MGKVGDRGGLRQAKLGDSDHLCNLHNLPGTNTGGQRSTVETPLLQEATNTHPFPVDSCELMHVCMVASGYKHTKVCTLNKYFLNAKSYMCKELKDN